VAKGVFFALLAVFAGQKYLQQFSLSRVHLVTPMKFLWHSFDSRLHRSTAVALCLVALVACSRDGTDGPETAVAVTDRLSILLITLDTTRADHLEPYGATDIETPALARLAREGVLFEQAVATAPVTAPTHASLLTGLYPPRHGVRNNLTHHLRGGIPTLAEWLSGIGYRTGAFVSAAVLERRYGLDQGFDVYDDHIRSSAPGLGRRMTNERSAGATADRALAWLDGIGDESYFLWVHFYDPHFPYSPPSPWSEKYRNRPYGGEIAYMDSQIDRLLRHPRSAGGDVVVLAIGDHGESLGEHGESTHGLLVYDSTLRIPWIMKFPGGPANLRVAAPICQVDLVPTITDMMPHFQDAEFEGLDGQSLMPLLRGQDWPSERLLFAESEVPFFSYGWSRLRAARQGAKKFIDAPVAELYDLEKDPGETQNLAADHPGDARRLAAEIETWAANEDDIDSSVSVDYETAEQLRALGYFAGDPGRPDGEGRGNPVDLMEVHHELQAVGRLLRTGQTEEAVQRARHALTMDPENLAALRDLSRGLLRLGRLDEAADVAARASALAPWSGQALVTQADAEYHRGQYQRALDLIDRALEMNDRFLEGRIERSRCLAALDRRDEAIAEIEPLIGEFADNNWVALRYAEIVELASGDFGAAEKRLRTVLDRNPRFTEAWLLLGTVLERAGRQGEAIAVYREAIDRDETNPEIQARLARCLFETRDPASEGSLLAAIRSSDTPRADLHEMLGQLFLELGRREKAMQQFQMAANTPAFTAAARNSKATALMHLGRHDEAEDLWRELVGAQPNSWRAWLNLASLSIQRQQWAEAEQFARKALEVEPTSAGAWNNLGISLEEMGRSDEAEAAYRRGADVDRRDWRALFNLGILLRIHSRYEEAEIVQYGVLDRNPAHGGAHFELGVLCAGPLNDPDRAKKHLQATIGADPDHPRAKQAQAVLERLP
jgi:arylsulfatase A-like enzyme/tetratricopeptide (TPR) repeat protein